MSQVLLAFLKYHVFYSDMPCAYLEQEHSSSVEDPDLHRLHTETSDVTEEECEAPNDVKMKPNMNKYI